MLKRFYGQKTRVMLVYALLAFLSFAVFGSLHIMSGDAMMGFLELAGAAAIVFVVVGLRITGNVDVARTGLLLTIIAMLIVMLATGGTQGTGIYWFFIFPVAAFFLSGSREGLFWMAFLGAVIAAVWASHWAAGTVLYYSGVEIRQLLVALFVVTVGVYVYQRSREKSDVAARHSQSELKANVKQTESIHTKVDHAKSEFLALTSHQLRTPISAIGWYGEMLLSGDSGKLDAEQRESVQRIAQSNKRLGAIVDAMLLVASLDLGQLDIKPEPLDLAKLTRSVLSEEKKKLPEKHWEITENYDSSLGKVMLDKPLTAIILRNILSNALKYTPDGGKIQITISPHTLTTKGDAVVVAVADNGYGIPQNQQTEIFAKMFRADNAKVKDTDGTGLGLYVVKGMLDKIGGKIWFESTEGKGSTFWIALPVDGSG